MKDNFAHRAADWDSPAKIQMTEIFVGEMLKCISLQKSWKALEIGAGTGLVGIQILPQVKSIVFEDTSAAMLDVLSKKVAGLDNVEVVLGEVIDYKRQDVDLVFSCMAFHHIVDIEKTLRHLAAITTPGALVVIGDLETEDGSFHRFEPIPHKGFDFSKLSEQFKSVGFDVLVVRPYHKLIRERVQGVIGEYTQFILIARKLKSVD